MNFDTPRCVYQIFLIHAASCTNIFDTYWLFLIHIEVYFGMYWNMYLFFWYMVWYTHILIHELGKGKCWKSQITESNTKHNTSIVHLMHCAQRLLCPLFGKWTPWNTSNTSSLMLGTCRRESPAMGSGGTTEQNTCSRVAGAHVTLLGHT